jgi:ElaB/YqjD/DUF883 family membrane-anchored ribosome-binding protein
MITTAKYNVIKDNSAEAVCMVLVSNTEIERLFGWSKGKAGVYASRGILPRPIQTLACGKLWRLGDVLYTAKERGWNVSEAALREIHASASIPTEEEREKLTEEIASLRAQIDEYRRLTEQAENARKNAELARENIEREYEWLRAKLVDVKNKYAEMSVRVERLREEEQRLLRNLTNFR